MNESATSHDRIERLEARVTELELLNTHLERLVEQLNSAILEQSRQLQTTELRLAKLTEMIDSASTPARPFKPEEEIPPHY